MTPPWAAASIRVRLTGWYALALAVMLIVYATATYVAVRHEFLEQLDDQLHGDFETAEGALSRTADGRVTWGTGASRDPDADDGHTFEAWSTLGEPLQRAGVRIVLPAPVLASAASSSSRYETVGTDSGRWRTLTALVDIGGRPVVLRVVRSQERVLRQLREILVVLALGLPLVVVLAGFCGYVLARRALAPIDHLAHEARRITAERLHERLTAVNQQDEIGRLTAVINDTFAHLEASFNQLRRFTADASHELRTPLSVVRGIGEAALARRRTQGEYEDAIGSMLEEADRMTSLVETLLRLSHADAGRIRLTRVLVDLASLVADVASSLGILAEERRQNVTLDVVDGVTVAADRLVLREAITNVLDNALKYSPAGSTIAIRVTQTSDSAMVTVADRGPGIPREHRAQIFDRFFRVDEARSRDAGGAGLGLAIARWAVEIHEGQITIEERPGGGSEFRIALPLARVPQTGEHMTGETPAGG